MAKDSDRSRGLVPPVVRREKSWLSSLLRGARGAVALASQRVAASGMYITASSAWAQAGSGLSSMWKGIAKPPISEIPRESSPSQP